MFLSLQVVEIGQEQAKLDWLLKKLPAMIDKGEVLVFANQIVRVDEITEKIKAIGHRQGLYVAHLCKTTAF